MDALKQNPNGPAYEAKNVGLHSGVEGEDDQQPQKKSVMKKVKARAKKLKGTFAKHTRGHGNDHHDGDNSPVHDDDDDDEEADDDEEMADSPEAHGPPKYDSPAIRDLDVPGREVKKEGPGVNSGKVDVMERVPETPASTPVTETNLTRVNDVDQGPIKDDSGRSTVKEEDYYTPKGRSEANDPANYLTKVTDPTSAGAEEAGINPILSSFEKMSVHDRGTPELPPSTKTKPEGTLNDSNTNESPQNQSNSYTDKLSFATSAITGGALSAKNLVASKLGYGGKDENMVSESNETEEREMDGSHEKLYPEQSLSTKTDSDLPQDDSNSKESPRNQSSSYTDKLPFATSAITGRALSAKNVVASKLGYGGKDDNPVTELNESEEREMAGTHDQFSPELSPPTKTDSDQLSPGLSPLTKTDSDQARDDSNTLESPQKQSSGYTDKLSFATSAITGRALSAKNVVASKLGYGAKDDNAVTESRESEETGTPKSPSSPSQTDGYGKKIASTVTGTLSPVYSRVASAGTTVMSKVTGSGAGDKTEDVDGKRPDKGVSVTQYLSEKWKPGEEDKALSEAISSSLYKSKDEGIEHREGKPMGKVTESEEVTNRLGTGDDYSEGGRAGSGEVKLNSGDASGVDKGMVNTVKGAVSSWFGKGEVGNGQEETRERKLQESSN